MKKTKLIKTFLYIPLVFPAVLCFLITRNKNIIRKDLERQQLDGKELFEYPYLGGAVFLLLLLVHQKAFRAVYYKRIGMFHYLLNYLLPQYNSCEIYGCRIGGGLTLLHGFSIVVNPKVIIGNNCSIHQNVTIGGTDCGTPIIGDNVFIGTGAIIIGPVIIGNNVKIGAGAVVVNDIPDNSTVVGPKAHII